MKRLIPVAALLIAAVVAAADHIPVAPEGVVELQGRAQLVASFGSFDVLTELLGRLEGSDSHFGYRSVTLGGYYRVIPNLKIGAFYRLQAGARHDDDWVANASPPPGWVWQDTTARGESVLMLDVSPRFQLPFLPGENWVFMLKTRLLWDTFNNQQSLMARPELTYFWIQDRVPVLNAALSYEMYVPLNFGSTPLYQAYPYLTLLWHATPEIGFELSGAYKTTIWSASASELAAVGTAYSVPFNSWVVSLGIVLTPAF